MDKRAESLEQPDPLQRAVRPKKPVMRKRAGTNLEARLEKASRTPPATLDDVSEPRPAVSDDRRAERPAGDGPGGPGPSGAVARK